MIGYGVGDGDDGDGVGNLDMTRQHNGWCDGV